MEFNSCMNDPIINMKINWMILMKIKSIRSDLVAYNIPESIFEMKTHKHTYRILSLKNKWTKW